jgi:hypothetical protein
VRANWVHVNRIVLGVLDGITLEQLNKPVPATVRVESIGRRAAGTAPRRAP